MRKCLLFLAMVALFTSCNNRDGRGHHGNGGDEPLAMDSVLIPMDSAERLIYNYYEYKIKILKEPKGYSSFILNANALREYLNANHDVQYLNVYLGKKEKGAMTDTSLTLIYIGGIDSSGYDVEVPYVKPSDIKQSKYLMDQAMPCPVCEKKIREYNPPTQ